MSRPARPSAEELRHLKAKAPYGLTGPEATDVFAYVSRLEGWIKRYRAALTEERNRKGAPHEHAHDHPNPTHQTVS